jgi:hypothetical protein
MIGQYLSNTNEIATVLILPKILELNKANPNATIGMQLNFFASGKTLSGLGSGTVGMA